MKPSSFQPGKMARTAVQTFLWSNNLNELGHLWGEAAEVLEPNSNALILETTPVGARDMVVKVLSGNGKVGFTFARYLAVEEET